MASRMMQSRMDARLFRQQQALLEAVGLLIEPLGELVAEVGVGVTPLEGRLVQSKLQPKPPELVHHVLPLRHRLHQ